MHALTTVARDVLQQMEQNRRYEAEDLRALAPDASAETLRDIMHELWVNRQVERVGHSGWQRRPSAAPHHASGEAAREPKQVKPDDLFDHTAFADFFK
jgi:hypothetical protein